MAKQDGAFLTIGELATELGVPHHILRYWESRFPDLRPLQRSGNRRYYRPEDVVLARTIHRLLNAEGYTVKGAQQALASLLGKNDADGPAHEKSVIAERGENSQGDWEQPQPAQSLSTTEVSDIIDRLENVRRKLQQLRSSSET